MPLRNIKGFTLLEIMIVIALFAVGMAIAIPNFSNMGKTSSVKTSARQLKDQLSIARASAIAQNTPITVTFDKSTNSYSFASTSIDLSNTIEDKSLPDETLTWDQRGYANKNLTITIKGKHIDSTYNVSISIAGSINITK